MPEYIERGAAIELLHYNADETCSAVVCDFEAIPAADVAPVVRCKDCKYWQDNNDGYPHEECRWGTEKHRMPMTFAVMESGGKNEKLE